MEEGTCQLTGSSFITVTLCSLYTADESAVETCVYLGVLHRDSQGGGICGPQESGQLCCFWHAVRHLACLPACLPPLTRHGVAGMLIGAV